MTKKYPLIISMRGYFSLYIRTGEPAPHCTPSPGGGCRLHSSFFLYSWVFIILIRARPFYIAPRYELFSYLFIYNGLSITNLLAACSPQNAWRVCLSPWNKRQSVAFSWILPIFEDGYSNQCISIQNHWVSGALTKPSQTTVRLSSARLEREVRIY